MNGREAGKQNPIVYTLDNMAYRPDRFSDLELLKHRSDNPIFRKVDRKSRVSFRFKSSAVRKLYIRKAGAIMKSPIFTNCFMVTIFLVISWLTWRTQHDLKVRVLEINQHVENIIK